MNWANAPRAISSPRANPSRDSAQRSRGRLRANSRKLVGPAGQHMHGLRVRSGGSLGLLPRRLSLHQCTYHRGRCRFHRIPRADADLGRVPSRPDHRLGADLGHTHRNQAHPILASGFFRSRAHDAGTGGCRPRSRRAIDRCHRFCLDRSPSAAIFDRRTVGAGGGDWNPFPNRVALVRS